MLGFRSLFGTHETPELLDATALQLRQWLVHKRLDPAALVEGPPTQLAHDTWASIQRLTDDVGTETLWARPEGLPGG